MVGGNVTRLANVRSRSGDSKRPLAKVLASLTVAAGFGACGAEPGPAIPTTIGDDDTVATTVGCPPTGAVEVATIEECAPVDCKDGTSAVTRSVPAAEYEALSAEEQAACLAEAVPPVVDNPPVEVECAVSNAYTYTIVVDGERMVVYDGDMVNAGGKTYAIHTTSEGEFYMSSTAADGTVTRVYPARQVEQGGLVETETTVDGVVTTDSCVHILTCVSFELTVETQIRQTVGVTAQAVVVMAEVNSTGSAVSTPALLHEGEAAVMSAAEGVQVALTTAGSAGTTDFAILDVTADRESPFVLGAPAVVAEGTSADLGAGRSVTLLSVSEATQEGCKLTSGSFKVVDASASAEDIASAVAVSAQPGDSLTVGVVGVTVRVLEVVNGSTPETQFAKVQVSSGDNVSEVLLAATPAYDGVRGLTGSVVVGGKMILLTGTAVESAPATTE